MRKVPFQHIIHPVMGWVLAAHLFYFLRLVGLEELTKPLPPPTISAGQWLFEATASGLLLGIIFGTVDIFLEYQFLHRRSYGQLILMRSFLFVLSLYLIIGLVYIVSQSVFRHVPADRIAMGLWKFYISPTYWVILVYSSLIAILINFIQQISHKFGPGNLLKLLKGTYQTPREEKRIFMFLDMKSSTAHAERLGHVRYSHLIQDCFYDMTEAVVRNKAEIYQYVGDEAVLTWTLENGLCEARCIRIYFDFMHALHQKAPYYQQKYGLAPTFKAGVNLGMVIAVEVGEIKREIVYHGEVLHTAARIQSKCNELNQCLLLSDAVKVELMKGRHVLCEGVGNVLLRGKSDPLALYSVRLEAQNGRTV